MPLGRRIWLVMAMTTALAGCWAGSMGSLSMLPRRSPPGADFDLEGFVKQHNRNSDSIESLEARPTVAVAMGRLFQARADGKMALERPRNFKLVLEAQGVQQADLGSNDSEFWFWLTSEKQDQKWIYWCSYRDLESSELPVTYQPDWIIEAMGLKSITAEETGAIQVRRGESGTMRLVFPPTRDRGEPYTREMLVSTTDRRIRKLQIYSAGPPRVLIAEAIPSEYQTYPIGSGSAGETCFLPQRLRLEWKRERLVLDVAVGREMQVNRFDPERAAALFVEPELPGYQRLNLAELSRGARSRSRGTRTRQTIPSPDPSDEVRLGKPAPIREEAPAALGVGRASPPMDDGVPPLPKLGDVVGRPTPRPPSSGSLPSASSVMLNAPGRDLSIE